MNWSWLCDKGRFGFEAFNSDQRLGEPLMRGADGELAAVRWSDALAEVAGDIRAAIDRRGPQSVAVLGGSRLTNESQYAWAKLAKSVIGTDNVDAQMGDGLPADAVLALPGTTIDDVCSPGTTVLWLGPDPKEELPVLHLRMRHARERDGVKLIELTPIATALGSLVSHRVPTRPGDAADMLRSLFGDNPTGAEHADAAQALRDAGDDLRVVVGRPNLAESADCVLDAAAVVLEAAEGARFLTVLRRANVRGAMEAGLAPGVLPGGQPLGEAADLPPAVVEHWGSVPATRGLDTAGILEAAAAGRIDVLVLLGADPLTDFPDRSLARRALAGAGTVISVDVVLNASASHATSSWRRPRSQRCDGTTTNLEGRVTRVAPEGDAAGYSALRLDARRGARHPPGRRSGCAELRSRPVGRDVCRAPLRTPR